MKALEQAIILLAGAGNRLGIYTKERPKCMVQVAGRPLLIRLLRQLERLEVSEVILVVGYKATVIKKMVGNSFGKISICYVENEDWKTTNNIVSLNLAKDALHTNFFLLEGDLFFSDGVLEKLVGENSMAVDHFREGMNGTVVTISENNHVKKFYLEDTLDRPSDDVEFFKTVNAYSMVYEMFNQELGPRLDKLIDKGHKNIYYEQAFADALEDGVVAFKIVKLKEKDWCEIDTEEDLIKARKIFNT